MDLDAGTKVTDSVTLVRPLGRGGMGSVWVAHHAALDAEVAVKFVSAELAEKDPTIITRFKREAALSAKIKSPHVVKTFDHGVMADGRPYIVMELLEGETLGEYLIEHERLCPRDAATVVSQIAAVLGEAHQLGVVHRDIKPDNVFLIDAGYDVFVKVLDFGIAKQTKIASVSSVTSTGTIVGTPEYMSPEQLLSTKSADFRADLWSLAVLAYHGFTGRVPFAGETLPSLSLSICSGRYTPPSELCEDLPAELDEWCARAFQPDPDDRFRSVSDMADTLRTIVRGSQPDRSSSQPRPGSGKSSGRRRKQSSDARVAAISSDPDADAEAETVRTDPENFEAQGATLASAASDEEHVAAAASAISVEEAPPAESGERPFIEPMVDAEASGRRPIDPDLAPQTPTFSGASSTLGSDGSVPARHRSWAKLGLVLVGAVLLAAAADLVLRRTGPAVKKLPTSAQSAATTTTVPDPWNDPEDQTAKQRTTARPLPPASSTATSSESATDSEPATASSSAARVAVHGPGPGKTPSGKGTSTTAATDPDPPPSSPARPQRPTRPARPPLASAPTATTTRTGSSKSATDVCSRDEPQPFCGRRVRVRVGVRIRV